MTPARCIKLALSIGLLSMSPAALAGEGSLKLDGFFDTITLLFMTSLVLTVQLVYALSLPRAPWKMKTSLALLMLAVDAGTAMLVLATSSGTTNPFSNWITVVLAGVPGILVVYLAHRLLNPQPVRNVGGRH